MQNAVLLLAAWQDGAEYGPQFRIESWWIWILVALAATAIIAWVVRRTRPGGPWFPGGPPARRGGGGRSGT